MVKMDYITFLDRQKKKDIDKHRGGLGTHRIMAEQMIIKAYLFTTILYYYFSKNTVIRDKRALPLLIVLVPCLLFPVESEDQERCIFRKKGH